MITIQGKYTDAKIFTDNIGDEALQTIEDIVNCPAFEGSSIRIMPDVHAGKGIVIGFTAPLGKFVNPSHIGVDIGCTVDASFYDLGRNFSELSRHNLEILELQLHELIGFGTARQQLNLYRTREELFEAVCRHISEYCASNGISRRIDADYIRDLLRRTGTDFENFTDSIGTVGGGNHFVEVGRVTSNPNELAVTVHCGSRNFGLRVANYYIERAAAPRTIDLSREEISKIVERCTKEGRRREISAELSEARRIKNEAFAKIAPTGYLEPEDFSGYILDMTIATAYADFNHRYIHRIIARIMKEYLGAVELPERYISTRHNYISPVDNIIRKGAVSAKNGERLVVPFNMRDGIAVCTGKGNPDWNNSCSHGAGRIMSRTAAKNSLRLEDFERTMEGIVSTTVCSETIDEAPQAYKDTNEIRELIADTVNIEYFLVPIVNIKATE